MIELPVVPYAASDTPEKEKKSGGRMPWRTLLTAGVVAGGGITGALNQGTIVDITGNDTCRGVGKVLGDNDSDGARAELNDQVFEFLYRDGENPVIDVNNCTPHRVTAHRVLNTLLDGIYDSQDLELFVQNPETDTKDIRGFLRRFNSQNGGADETVFLETQEYWTKYIAPRELANISTYGKAEQYLLQNEDLFLVDAAVSNPVLMRIYSIIADEYTRLDLAENKQRRERIAKKFGKHPILSMIPTITAAHSIEAMTKSLEEISSTQPFNFIETFYEYSDFLLPSNREALLEQFRHDLALAADKMSGSAARPADIFVLDQQKEIIEDLVPDGLVVGNRDTYKEGLIATLDEDIAGLVADYYKVRTQDPTQMGLAQAQRYIAEMKSQNVYLEKLSGLVDDDYFIIFSKLDGENREAVVRTFYDNLYGAYENAQTFDDLAEVDRLATLAIGLGVNQFLPQEPEKLAPLQNTMVSYEADIADRSEARRLQLSLDLASEAALPNMQSDFQAFSDLFTTEVSKITTPERRSRAEQAWSLRLEVEFARPNVQADTALQNAIYTTAQIATEQLHFADYHTELAETAWAEHFSAIETVTNFQDWAILFIADRDNRPNTIQPGHELFQIAESQANAGGLQVCEATKASLVNAGDRMGVLALSDETRYMKQAAATFGMNLLSVSSCERQAQESALERIDMYDIAGAEVLLDQFEAYFDASLAPQIARMKLLLQAREAQVEAIIKDANESGQGCLADFVDRTEGQEPTAHLYGDRISIDCGDEHFHSFTASEYADGPYMLGQPTVSDPAEMAYLVDENLSLTDKRAGLAAFTESFSGEFFDEDLQQMQHRKLQIQIAMLLSDNHKLSAVAERGRVLFSHEGKPYFGFNPATGILSIEDEFFLGQMQAGTESDRLEGNKLKDPITSTQLLEIMISAFDLHSDPNQLSIDMQIENQSKAIMAGGYTSFAYLVEDLAMPTPQEEMTVYAREFFLDPMAIMTIASSRIEADMPYQYTARDGNVVVNNVFESGLHDPALSQLGIDVVDVIGNPHWAYLVAAAYEHKQSIEDSLEKGTVPEVKLALVDEMRVQFGVENVNNLITQYWGLPSPTLEDITLQFQTPAIYNQDKLGQIDVIRKRKSKMHQGLDVADEDTPGETFVGVQLVSLTSDAVVIRKYHCGRPGKPGDCKYGIELYDPHTGLIFKYLHIKNPSIEAGTVVRRGDVVGEVESGGEGPHLHLEIKRPKFDISDFDFSKLPSSRQMRGKIYETSRYGENLRVFSDHDSQSTRTTDGSNLPVYSINHLKTDWNLVPTFGTPLEWEEEDYETVRAEAVIGTIQDSRGEHAVGEDFADTSQGLPLDLFSQRGN